MVGQETWAIGTLHHSHSKAASAHPCMSSWTVWKVFLIGLIFAIYIPQFCNNEMSMRNIIFIYLLSQIYKPPLKSFRVEQSIKLHKF
jgi:hypothetical protein